MTLGFAFDADDFKMDLEIAIGDINAEMAEEIADKIKEILIKDGTVVTGQLAKTTFWEIDQKTPMAYIVGTEAPYALWVEFGSRARQVPFDAIAFWVETKFGLTGRERDEVAWKVIKKIADEGIKGLRFTYRAVDEVVRTHGGTQ